MVYPYGGLGVCKSFYYREIYNMQSELKVVKDTYFKQSTIRLVSGLPLPKDEYGCVSNTHFINCNFHSNCVTVPFINCTFTDCEGAEDLGPEPCCCLYFCRCK